MTIIPAGTEVRVLGRLDYDAALALQAEERERVMRGESPGTVFLLEHDPPVITLGRRADVKNLLADENTLARKGYRLRRVERGGDVTVHEPGQVVAYFVVPVMSKGSGPFVEEALGLASGFLRERYGVIAEYHRDRPGLWAGNAKLCAVGLDLRGGASMHGIAINVSNSLEGFSLVVPCGIEGGAVTSVSAVLGRKEDAASFMEGFARYLRGKTVS